MSDITAGDFGEDVRDWVYGQVAALFGSIPARLEPYVDAAALEAGAADRAPGRAGAPSRFFPRTRAAIAALIDAFGRQRHEQVAVDQVRLFVNAPDGVPAPPYASWYLDRRLLGPSCDWAAEQYREQALEVAADAGKPADYVGTGLEYMHFLCRHIHAARLTGDRAAFELARAAQRRFFQDHLVRWLPEFAARIRAAAPGGVYARVADLLVGFCEEEAAGLR